jgi:hypothetical protein
MIHNHGPSVHIFVTDDKNSPRATLCIYETGSTGRIANAVNLFIALTGELPSSEVSLGNVRMFIEEPTSRRDIASKVATADKLDDFLDLVESALHFSPPSDPEDFVDALSEIAEFDAIDNIETRRRGSFLKPTARLLIFWILKQVLERLPSDKSTYLINHVCSSANKMAISIELLEFLCSQQGILDGNPRTSEETWIVTPSELQRLIQVWVTNTRDAFFQGTAFSSREAGPAFLLLRRLDSSAAREVASRSLERAGTTDSFARVIGSGSWDSIKGPYASIDSEFLSLIGDPEELLTAARARLDGSASLTPDLRAIYASIVSGSKQYYVDFEQ